MTAATLPYLVDWTWKVVVEPRPFWAGIYDPELIYFNEGLGLLRGEAPRAFDRPGIPVQLLSAVLVGALGADPLAVDRLRVAAYVVTALCSLAGVALLHRTLLRDTPASLRLTAIWLFFLCPAALDFGAIWSPESLYLPVGALVLAALCRSLERVGGANRADALSLGAALGLAISLKFTFLAWVVAALVAVVVAGRAGAARGALWLLASVAASFALLASYLLPRTQEMLAWLWRLASRSGEYGSGPSGLPVASEIATRLAAFVLATKKWHVALAVVAAAALLAVRRADGRSEAATRRGLGAFALSALAVSYLLAIRNPQPRYLLANGLVGVVLIRLASDGALLRSSARWRAGLAAAVGLLLFRQVGQDLATHRRVVAAANAERLALEAAVRQHAPQDASPVVVYSYRAPMPSYALHAFAQSEREHAAIFAGYPKEGYVDWDGTVRLPPGRSAWDLLVASTVRPPGLHEPTGVPVAAVGEYLILPPPAQP